MGLVVRRAESGDQRGLTTLVSKAGGPALFRKVFGSYNFGQMIETSYLSVSALSSFDSGKNSQQQNPRRLYPGMPAEELVGFAVLSDTPRSGLSEDWLEWFSETHAPPDAEITMTNVLWVNFAIAASPRIVSGMARASAGDESKEQQDEADAAEVIERIVRTVFSTLPEVDYLVMSLTGETGADRGGKGRGGGVISAPKYVLTAFEVLTRHADASTNKLDEAYGKPLLLLCDRIAFLPTLAVRTACVEDHDDLMPVFAARGKQLSDTYGEFFLADMIELQDEENKALAALVQGRACGLLATSSDLELGLLQTCFQLDDYEHLVKLSPEMRAKMSSRRRRASEVASGSGFEADLETQEIPRILLLGPPGAGKTTLALLLAARYRSTLVSVDAEAKAAAEAGSEQGERAIKLLDAGEVLPTSMVLDLVASKLASRDCQRNGWVLEGTGTAGGVDELEEAIVMATEVGMEDFTATRPNLVIVLDLPLEADVLMRVRGRRVDITTGNKVYHETLRPPPEGGENSFVLEALPGDGNPAVISARLKAYQRRCDGIVRSFAVAGGTGEAGGTSNGRASEADGGGVPTEGTVAFIRAQPTRSVGGVLVLDANETVESILDQACSAINAKTAADDIVASGRRGSDAGGSSSSAALVALPPNAFAVTLFCLESSLESRAADFLPHAFLLYPDRDYCVLTVPSVGAESALLRHFSAVPARPGSAFSHVLYVMHRDSLPAYKYLRVSRFLGSSHRTELSRLLECWGGADDVMGAVKGADRHQTQDLVNNPPSAAFVATLGHQVVGVFVASREACGGDEVARICSEFHVEDFLSFDRHRPRNQALLTALALNPLFGGHCRFALKEVMRLYDKSVIYWRSAPGSNLPASVPWHMIPVRPRFLMQPQPGYPSRTYAGFRGAERVNAEPSALYFLSRRFITEPKITANHRVVIVGASTTALACLEGLVFTPYLNLTSLTLVSPDGIPTAPATELRGVPAGNRSAVGRSAGGAIDARRWVSGRAELSVASDACDGSMIQFSPVDEDAPDGDRMAMMGLNRHVRVVRSRMVHLDRENGAILLPDGSVMPYDVLVLCTGLQDDTSRRLGLWAPGLNPSDPRVPGFVSLDSPFLRSDLERNLASVHPDSAVVIYADVLKALCAAQGLLDLGVAPGRISLVRPISVALAASRQAPSSDSFSPLCKSSWSLGDATVDAAAVEDAIVASGLVDSGERCLEGVRLDTEGRIFAAVFTKFGAASGAATEVVGKGQRRQHRSISNSGGATEESVATGKTKEDETAAGEDGENSIHRCELLLCGDVPNVDPDIFCAVNNSGLVYDGRLVVDTMFRTSDPAVLAGGRLTKFSRVHCAGPDTPRHEKCNSREIGAHLAACVLRQVDPFCLVDGNDSGGYDGETVGVDAQNSDICTQGGDAASTLDPLTTSSEGSRGATASQELQASLPRFDRPRCVSGKLPGGLYYVRATLPKAGVSTKRRGKGGGDGDKDVGDGGQGKEGSRGSGRGTAGLRSFTTGKIVVEGCSSDSTRSDRRVRNERAACEERDDRGDAAASRTTGNYCSMRVDSLDRVCDVIYCGREAVEAKNLSRIVGVQLGYLQNLEAAFKSGEVSDLIEFFRQGALTPLYHDRFPELVQELRESMADGDEWAADLLTTLDKGIDEGTADEWLSLTTRNAVGRGAVNLPPSTRKTVEARVLEWVRRNRAMLPSLALPQLAAHTPPRTCSSNL